MHPHESRPSSICHVETLPTQHPTVRIRPSRTHEDGFHPWVSAQILRERFLHGRTTFPFSCHLGVTVVGRVDVELEVVFLGRGQGEGCDGVERMGGRDIDCWKGGRERRVGGEEREVED